MDALTKDLIAKAEVKSTIWWALSFPRGADKYLAYVTKSGTYRVLKFSAKGKETVHGASFKLKEAALAAANQIIVDIRRGIL